MTNGNPSDIEPGRRLTSSEKEALARDNERMTRQAHEAASEQMRYGGPQRTALEIAAEGIKRKVENDEFSDY